MIELLIVMAATLSVFMFLLVVLYVHNRRKAQKPHIHTCANCTCDRRDVLPGQTGPLAEELKKTGSQLERIAELAGQTDKSNPK